MVPAHHEQKILIVEDEPDTRIFISNVLSSQGYDALFAENRTEGFQKAMDENPSVIIIDMMIPNEGGVQLYCNLKRDALLKRIPVIMLSTIDRKTFYKWHKTHCSGSTFREPGPDTYLGKPPEAEELILTVRRLSGAEMSNQSKPKPSSKWEIEKSE